MKRQKLTDKQTDRFANWLRERGTAGVAHSLNKHQASVDSWLRRRTLPTVYHMMKLVEISEGAFDYKDIIEPYFVVNAYLIDRYKSLDKIY